MATSVLTCLTALLLCLWSPKAWSLVPRHLSAPVPELQPQGRDCSHIWATNSSAPSGVYVIQPEGASTPFQVLCDMREGGWTVIQQRQVDTEQPLDFERCWQEYKQGFGALEGEHWLGLDHIMALTTQPGRQAELMVDLENRDKVTLQAHYDHFHIGSEADRYRLHLGQYFGNAASVRAGRVKGHCLLPTGHLYTGDAFHGSGQVDSQEGSPFSTLDRDRDACAPCVKDTHTFSSCSLDRMGAGWWYSSCGQADLNGPKPQHPSGPPSLLWGANSRTQVLSSSVMLVHTTSIP